MKMGPRCPAGMLPVSKVVRNCKPVPREQVWEWVEQGEVLGRISGNRLWVNLKSLETALATHGIAKHKPEYSTTPHRATTSHEMHRAYNAAARRIYEESRGRYGWPENEAHDPSPVLAKEREPKMEEGTRVYRDPVRGAE